MVFQGYRLVFHGFRAVLMVFHGSRLVCHGFKSVFPYLGPTIPLGFGLVMMMMFPQFRPADYSQWKSLRIIHFIV